MADSNKTRFSVNYETVLGDGGTTAWFELGILSESLKSDLTLASSDTMRSSRDVPGLHLTDKGVSGSINADFRYLGEHHGLVPRVIGTALWSASTPTTICTNLTTTIYGSTNIISTTPHSTPFDVAAVVGQWIYITGAANAASNGFHKVAAVSTTDTITVETDLLATEVGVDLTIVMFAQVVNGDTVSSFALQREYTDLSNESVMFKGLTWGGYSIDASGTDTVKISYDLIGLTETSESTPETVGGALDPTPVFTTTEGVKFVRLDAADVTVLSFQFQVANNFRQKKVLGTLGSTDFNFGDFEVTGSMQMYFADSTEYDKFLDQDEVSLAICFSDDQGDYGGDGFLYDFPKVKFTDGQRMAGGRNQDIIADFSWQALYDADEDLTLRIALIQ
jgi:hypothetical protein